jgi:large subunit ribosomal protein L3
MANAIYGKKVGSTQVFDTKGNVVFVTAIEAEPLNVVQIKTEKTDGYNSIKVGFGNIRPKHVNKPLKGEFDKAKSEPKKYLREIKLDKPSDDFKLGDSIDVSIFNAGDVVKIIGKSKGKGFAGVIKRHKFHRGRMTHGSHNHRIPGSIGMCATPSRVLKGKKMPGRMGNDRITIAGTDIVDVLKEENLILVRGSVPGAKGNIVYIQKV